MTGQEIENVQLKLFETQILSNSEVSARGMDYPNVTLASFSDRTSVCQVQMFGKLKVVIWCYM